MGELNPDESSMRSVFDIVLDEGVSDSEDVGIEYERVHKLSPRSSRRISKKYIRPIFKEPGSKIPKKLNHIESDLQYGTIPTNLKTQSFYDNEEGIRQALYYPSRLEYIVGKPIERYRYIKGDNPVTLRTRLVQNISIINQNDILSCKLNSYADPDCGSSIASASDIERLEAKKLRRRSERRGLNPLRQEINRIVSSNLDVRDPEVSRRFPQILADSEGREGFEGCASHGCVNFLEDGVAAGVQDLINDMKEYWTTGLKKGSCIINENDDRI